MRVGMNNVAASSFEHFCWSSPWIRVSSSCEELVSLLTLRCGVMESEWQGCEGPGSWECLPGDAAAHEEQIPVGRCQFNLKAFMWSHCCLSCGSEITGQWFVIWTRKKEQFCLALFHKLKQLLWSFRTIIQVFVSASALLELLLHQKVPVQPLLTGGCEGQSSWCLCEDVTSLRAAVSVIASPFTCSSKLLYSPEESLCLVPWGEDQELVSAKWFLSFLRKCSVSWK